MDVTVESCRGHATLYPPVRTSLFAAGARPRPPYGDVPATMPVKNLSAAMTLVCLDSPLWVISGCEHRNKPHHYSITSSAATNRVGEISTPNALAVLRLMTKLESLLDGHIAGLLTTQNTINVPGRARKVLKII
jgi:hypothetical protein